MGPAEENEPVGRHSLRDWTTILSEEVPEQDFLEMIARHAFVLCVSGGGLDPSPKAWVSLLHGAIPIVRSGSLDAAYRELPVAFVPDWLPESITAEKLRLLQEQLAPALDVAPKGRRHLPSWGSIIGGTRSSTPRPTN